MRERKYDAIADMMFGESVTATILLDLIGSGAFKLGVGKDRPRQFFDATASGEDVEGAYIIRTMASLMKLFGTEYPDAAVILSAAPNARAKMEAVMRVHSEKVYKVPEGCSIRENAGLLKHLDFLLTPDTSIGNIASCVDLPSLPMYPGNMENFEVWRPFDPYVRAINSPDFCSTDCLRAEPVFKTFRGLIEDQQREPVSTRG